MDNTKLKYSHKGDAGYDLYLDLEKNSENSEGFAECLKNIGTNINFYQDYLPKLYLNGELFGDLRGSDTFETVINYLAQDKPYVVLPPSRVGMPELNSKFVNYKNHELCKTRFDFVEPGKWELVKEALSHGSPEMLDGYLLYAGLVQPRSGLGTKHLITVANSPGLVDSNYRGNVMVGMVNYGRDIHMFTNGARVGQLVLPLIMDNGYGLNAEKDPNVQRGADGFGSTGVS